MTSSNRSPQSDPPDSFDFNDHAYGRRRGIPPWLLVGIPLIVVMLVICSAGISFLDDRNQRISAEDQISATRTRIARTEQAATVILIHATQDTLNRTVMDQTRSAVLTSAAPSQDQLYKKFVTDYMDDLSSYTIPTTDDLSRYTAEEIEAFTEKLTTDQAYRQRAQTHMQAQRYYLAIADYNEAIKQNPHYSYYLGRGDAWLKIGLYDKALADFSNAQAWYKGDQRNPIVLRQAQTYHLIGDNSARLDYFARANDLTNSARGLYIFSLILSDGGADNIVIKENLEAALRLSEKKPIGFEAEMHFYLGQIHSRMGNPTLAHLSYEHVHAVGGFIDPVLAHEFELAYQFNLTQLTPDEIITLTPTQIQTATPEPIRPSPTPTIRPLATIPTADLPTLNQDLVTKYQTELDQITQAFETDPHFIDLLKRGDVLLKQGSYDAALNDFRMAETLYPNPGLAPSGAMNSIYMRQAHALILLDDLENARNILHQEPNLVEEARYYFVFGLLQTRLNNSNSARASLQIALAAMNELDAAKFQNDIHHELGKIYQAEERFTAAHFHLEQIQAAGGFADPRYQIEFNTLYTENLANLPPGSRISISPTPDSAPPLCRR